MTSNMIDDLTNNVEEFDGTMSSIIMFNLLNIVYYNDNTAESYEKIRQYALTCNSNERKAYTNEFIRMIEDVFENENKNENEINLINLLETSIAFSITKKELKLENIFILACRCGYLKAAQYIKERFKFSREEIMNNYNYSLIGACERGQIEIVKWLDEICNFTRTELVMNNNEAFIQACSNKHYDIAKWLYGMTYMTKEELTMQDNIAFKQVCIHNNMEMVMFFMNKCNFTRDELFHNINNYCSNCSSSTMTKKERNEYLKKTLESMTLFKTCCTVGNLDIVKMFHEKYTFTQNEINNSKMFFIVCCVGELDVAKWIYETFNITQNELLDILLHLELDDFANVKCCHGKYNLDQVKQWLRSKSNFNTRDILKNSQVKKYYREILRKKIRYIKEEIIISLLMTYCVVTYIPRLLLTKLEQYLLQ